MRQSEKWESSPTLDEVFALERQEGKVEGKIEGKIEGKVEGMLEERRNVSFGITARRFSVEYIAELTKLDLTEVEELRKTLE